ncbi:thioesterase [Luteimonas aestuarii]|uniref:Thioesterase n=1 Tax=Luteimonas aestuarii TaxID=453837 RepID=A0A4R5U4L0_9GAMM|nr:alpha/beta fold hydrolase [Luteimonas aestuarii]TDK28523.1 thioesterase [Luteimonas aestuarii]
MEVRLKCLSPRPMATVRLLCLPFAGAGASLFRGWPDALPPHVEAYAVQFPGREDRLADAPFTRWERMVDALEGSVRSLHPQPTAIFGHSLGALAAYALAHRLQHAGTPRLVHLFVSARPWHGDGATASAPAWSLDDDALLAGMAARFGALPASLSHPEIRDVALPVLRADLRLLEDHRDPSGQPLACPLTVFAGAHDPSTPPSSLEGWRAGTSADFAIEQFGGGHFFIESHRHALVASISARLPPPARW